MLRGLKGNNSITPFRALPIPLDVSPREHKSVKIHFDSNYLQLWRNKFDEETFRHAAFCSLLSLSSAEAEIAIKNGEFFHIDF
jgi:hypothetical protein